MLKSSNPALNENSFKRAQDSSLTKVMTLKGTINKSIFLILLCMAGTAFGWVRGQALIPYMTISLIAIFILALVIIFKQSLAPVLAPVYAIAEGLVLGILSAAFEARFPGIVFQAFGITMITFLVMLSLYKGRIITVTNKLRSIIISATLGICVFYLITLGLSLFGFQSFLASSSGLSIAVSVFVCLVAAFNFLLDFDFIERATNSAAAPKYMEWYAGFGLLLTIVWLYIELLSLLSKLQSRN